MADDEEQIREKQRLEETLRARKRTRRDDRPDRPPRERRPPPEPPPEPRERPPREPRERRADPGRRRKVTREAPRRRELLVLEGTGGLLPPWPDELLVAAKKERALFFLRGLRLPSRIAGRHLGAWGKYTGVELTRKDFSVVRRDVSPTPPW